jgi:hypothetical protein
MMMKHLILAALAAVALTGCSTPKDSLATNPALTEAGKIVVRMAIRRGVSDYIASHGPSSTLARAVRIKAVLDDVVLAINGDPSTPLAALKAVAYSKISPELTPLEQQEARDVIDLVATVIDGYIGQGTLNGDAIVKVKDALDWIAQAAALYSPPA